MKFESTLHPACLDPQVPVSDAHKPVTESAGERMTTAVEPDGGYTEPVGDGGCTESDGEYSDADDGKQSTAPMEVDDKYPADVDGASLYLQVDNSEAMMFNKYLHFSITK